jgi:acyl dehydratase
MHAEGYASPEEKGDRQTPYVTSELRCQRPIRVGDEVTSVVTLAETYERRGSQFVVWECRAVDARGEHVLAYRYTTIWRQAPRDPSAPPAPRPAPARAPVASPADLLPTILKVESQEAIDAYAELTRLQPRQHNNTLHSNPEFARRTIFGGTVNMGVATAAYCAEVVEQAFGPDALLQPGARLEYKGIKPIRAGYEITIDGQVVARQPDGLVTCELTVMNREGLLCGVASATARPNGR